MPTAPLERSETHPVETPAAIVSIPRMLAVFGLVSGFFILDLIGLGTKSLDIAVFVVIMVSLFVLLFVGLVRYASVRVKLSLSNEGIVESRKNVVQPTTIAWSAIDEYLFERDPNGNASIRLRLKPDGRKLRYSPRSMFSKSRKPFEEFALVLTERINAINQAADAHSAPGTLLSNSLLESAAQSAPHKIKEGVSFYDKPIAKVIAVVFAVIYALGLLGVLLARKNEPFPFRFLYMGALVFLFVARVFSKKRRA